MHDRNYAVLMATYNQWMNIRLYDLCGDLPDTDYRRDLGAFFGSLHATLNHILLTDRLFLAFLSGAGVDHQDPRTIIADKLAQLRSERDQHDEALLAWAETLADGQLAEPIQFAPGRRIPGYVVAAQMYNHQTHHRGQITAMLTQLSVDVGATDIPAMPLFRELADAVSGAPAAG